MSNQYEMEPNASEVSLPEGNASFQQRRNPTCCSKFHPDVFHEFPRYGLEGQFTARLGETFSESFQILYPFPGYIVAYMEENSSYISLDLVLYKRELIPVTDYDVPDNLKDGYEIKYYEVSRCEDGETLEIPGDCACDHMVQGFIKFSVPNNVAHGTLNNVLVIDRNDFKEKIPLQIEIT